MAEENDWDIAEIADSMLDDAAWSAWVSAHPEGVSEAVLARRVHVLLARLQEAQITLPPDFQTRLFQRLQADVTLLDVVDLGFAGFGRVLIELLNAFLSVLPAAEQQPAL